MDREPLDSLLKFGATTEGKIRLIQETVPGKQVTLAHIIANPDAIIYKKLGLQGTCEPQYETGDLYQR